MKPYKGMTEEEREEIWPSTFTNVIKKITSYPVDDSTTGNIWNEHGDAVIKTRTPTKLKAVEFMCEIFQYFDNWEAPHISLAEDGDYCFEWWGTGQADERRDMKIYVESSGELHIIWDYKSETGHLKLEDDEMKYPWDMEQLKERYRWMMEKEE